MTENFRTDKGERIQAEEKTDKWREFTCIGLREEIHLAGRGGGHAWLGSPAAIISWYQRSESSLGIEGLLHAGWVWSSVQVKGGWMGNWYSKERRDTCIEGMEWYLDQKIKSMSHKSLKSHFIQLSIQQEQARLTQTMVHQIMNTSTPGNNTHLNGKWLGGATLAGVNRVSDNSLEWLDWRCGGGVNFGHPEQLV